MMTADGFLLYDCFSLNNYLSHNHCSECLLFTWSLSSRVGHESVNFSVVKAFGKVG